MNQRSARKTRQQARKAERQARADAEYWFPQKRYGLGAGLPIRWQGWALVASYAAAICGIGLLEKSAIPGNHALAAGAFVLATTYFLITVARRTRGGWKWRWGGK